MVTTGEIVGLEEVKNLSIGPHFSYIFRKEEINPMT